MTSTSRSARLAKWLSIPAGLAISALIVWQASYAAFSDTTTSPNNSWQAGTMELTHDAADTVLFDARNLFPGDTDTQYTLVTYEGPSDAEVSLYGHNYYFSSSTDNLAKHIQLRIELGAGGEFDSGAGFVPYVEVFDGTLDSFGNTHTTFENGLRAHVTGLPAPVGEVDQATLKFTYTLSEDAPNEVQGGDAKIDFVGEARQN